MSCANKQESELKVLLGLFKPSPAGNRIYKETVIIYSLLRIKMSSSRENPSSAVWAKSAVLEPQDLRGKKK